MRNRKKLIKTAGLILIIILIAGCSSVMQQGSEQDAGEVAICDLSEELIGWRVTTSGKVSFLDLSPRDGVYIEFKDNGCEAGGFAHNEFWNDFSEDQQNQIALDNTLTVEGILTRDGGRMIVSVQKVLGSP